MGIILIALYPNATRILQPADVAAFEPLKTGWQKGILEWRREHPHIRFTKENFAPLLSKVINKYINNNIIRNGFKATGLFPWNADSIDYSKCLSNVNVISNNVENDLSPTEPEQTKLMDFAAFKSIIGEETLYSLEMKAVSNEPKMKYLQKILEFFTNPRQHNQLDINSMPIDIVLQINNHEADLCSIEFKTKVEHANDHTVSIANQEFNNLKCDNDYVNIADQHNLGILDDEVNAALEKYDSMLESIRTNTPSTIPLPSTSTANNTPLSISQILLWPETPKRKNIRNSEKFPYVIPSEGWRRLAEEKKNKKRIEEEAKENRKRKRLENRTKIQNKTTKIQKNKPTNNENKPTTRNKRNKSTNNTTLVKITGLKFQNRIHICLLSRKMLLNRTKYWSVLLISRIHIHLLSRKKKLLNRKYLLLRMKYWTILQQHQ